jgi:hypothetical protein
MVIVLKEDLQLERTESGGVFLRGDRFDSRNWNISEDDLNYYIHGLNVSNGYSSSNYLTIPKYAAYKEG